MSEDSKITSRLVVDLSISKSYLGILRIAHITEQIDGSPDSFLNKDYYGVPSLLIDISGNKQKNGELGYQRAAIAFDGGVVRYSSDDPFKDRILPVTDSAGNYLNWNAGEIAFTIGSNPNISGHSRKEQTFSFDGESSKDNRVTLPIIFPVLTAQNIVIGFEKLEPVSSKNTISLKSKLSLESSDNANAEIVINNYYDHSNLKQLLKKDKLEDNFEKEYFFYNYQRPENDKTTKFRTIIRNTNDSIKEYDSFIYHLDNYDTYNYEQNNKFVDSIVDVENLVEYVNERVKLYNSATTVEVPTGTVIWQHVSLDKWYNVAISGDACLIKDFCFPANNPPMDRYNIGETHYDNSETGKRYSERQEAVKLAVNNIQGATRGGNHILSMMNDVAISNFFTLQVPEVIPLYKRDYVLCDGSSYTIYCYRKLTDSLTQDNHDVTSHQNLLLYESYDRFINLFFSVGYWYTPYNGGVLPYFMQNALYEKTFDENEQHYTLNGTKRVSTGGYNKFDKSVFEGITPTSHTKWTNEMDRYVLFGLDLIKLLTYRLVTEERRKQNPSLFENGIYSASKTKEWIKTQLIDKDFIFNTMIGWSNTDVENLINDNLCTPDAKTNMGTTTFVIEHKYSNSSMRRLSIQGPDVKSTLYLGREVNAYNSPILTYNYNKTTLKWSYYICNVFELAEVNDVIEQLEVITIPAKEKEYFKDYNRVEFRVPNLMNELGGSFIGSTMYTWRNEATLFTRTASWSPIVGSELPHRHSLYRGHSEPYTNGKGGDDNRSKMITENTRPAANASYHTELRSNPASYGEVTWKNYVIAEVDDTETANGLEKFKYEPIVTYNFLLVKEILSKHPLFKTGYNRSDEEQLDPRTDNAEPQRAPTGPPVHELHLKTDYNYYWNAQLYIDTELSITKGSETSWVEGGGRAELFVPWSISMLPLIKL